MSDEYKKYQHVEKFGTSEVDGINFGTCYIFPKIDGTNGHIWEDGESIRLGSRRRELTLEEDNAGFCRWFEETSGVRDKFTQIFDVFPDAHIYGEWLVPHTMKTYRDDSWRKFYIFDIRRRDDSYVKYNEYKEILDTVGYEDYIPPLRIITNPTEENIVKCLEANDFLIQDGQGVGEGVVVKNYDFVNKYDHVVWAKYVRSDFKAKHIKEMGAPEIKGSDYIEEKIVETFLMDDIIDKVHANIMADKDGWHSKCIGELLGRVFHDFVKEECWNFISKNKLPTIDFKTLNRFVVMRIKSHKPELF